jgi:hypothetical protein
MRKTDKKLEGMKTLVLRKTSFLELKEKPVKIETLMALDLKNQYDRFIEKQQRRRDWYGLLSHRLTELK